MASEPQEPLIYQRMVAILRDTLAIGKDMTNQAQGFKFRGIDQVYNDMHPIFSRHGVFIIPVVEEHDKFEKTTKSGGFAWHHFLRVRFWFVAEDGSKIDAVGMGEAADSGDKGVNKCMSVALKYALFQTFLIPTQDDKDPDASIPEGSISARRRTKHTPEQERIVAQKTGIPPEPPSAPSGQKTTPLYEALRAFAEMKVKIGSEDYYRILGNNGYEKSNQITTVEEARKIFRQMAQFSIEQANAKEQV